MKIKQSNSRKAFIFFNYIFLSIVAIICFLPIIHVLAMSFSSGWAVEAGMIKLWPVEFTTKSYEFVVKDGKFLKALLISLQREGLGVSIQMLLVILAAYPMSKSKASFKFRDFYVWFFLITILFHGGLIPTYLVIKKAQLINTIWALVIPSAVPVFSIVLLQNFFKALPKEIEESAFMDGAGHWTTLIRIYIPLSKPAIATLVLFSAVNHWNSWFDGILYMNRPENYPLQSYLQTVIVKRDLSVISSHNIEDFMDVVEKSSKAAQIFLAMLPILMVYPFLQKYFTTGITLGSVKG
jgi:putative aldouronate transport system permease protein